MHFQWPSNSKANYRSKCQKWSRLPVAYWNFITLLVTGSQYISLSFRKSPDWSRLSIRITPAKPRELMHSSPQTTVSYSTYHSVPKYNSDLHDVIIAMKCLVHTALISREPVSPRLSKTRFRNTSFNVTTITVYAPTPRVELNSKGGLYSQLHCSVNRIPRCLKLRISGYWNAHRGQTDQHVLEEFVLNE